MKHVIIIAIAFVLLIPIPVFAEDVYIQIDELPEWADYASNVMYLSTEAWKEANEDLKFWVVENSSDADFMVKWVRDFGGEYVGYAYGNQFIEVGLGDSICLNKWNPYSEKFISHIMKHEIGHVFGFEHDNNPDSIMYPVALNLEYGLVEEEYRLTVGHGQFVPFCTIKDLTSYDFSVSTTDETYGFDYYIVPSIDEFDKLVEGKVFQHYSNKDCFGENWLSISGTCKGVSAGSGIMILMDSELTTPLVTITVGLTEIPNIINSKSMLTSNNYIDFEKVPSAKIIHDTATIDVNIFGDTFDFSSSFYQNKDNSIRFENGNGRTIHKYTEHASIGQLFDSFGMSFTNDCLMFRDGRSFCNNEDYSFTFYVNGQTHYLLSQYVFEDGDNIKIIFGPIPKITHPTNMPSESIPNLSEIRDCSSGSYGDLCKESEYVIWDKNRPLVWDDFQGIPGTFDEDHNFSTLSIDATEAWTFYGIDWKVWWEKSNNTPCEYKITKLDVVAVTSKIESWVRTSKTNDDLLKHEQGHFDIAQIHAQEFKVGYEGKDFACPSGIYDDDEIFNEIDGFWLQIEDDFHAMQKIYDTETEYHSDRKTQAEWDKKIKSLLSTEEYVKETSIPKPTEEQTIEEGGGCLIATATYGSEMSLQVQQLRELRDNTLLNTESGTQFMGMFNEFYYSFSPVIADYERENPVFKEMVKIAITPMISSLSILNYVNMDSEAEVLGYGISLILLNVGMYLGIPAIVIIGIRKKF